MKFDPSGRLQMILGRQTVLGRPSTAGNNESKDAFNEPTNIAFAKNGDFFISDGYVNSRVIKFAPNGQYLTHWGRKGTADGEFNLVHDVVLDKAGRVYVADRTNERVQIFDGSGKFLGKWTNIGAPWGLDYVAREDAIYRLRHSCPPLIPPCRYSVPCPMIRSRLLGLRDSCRHHRKCSRGCAKMSAGPAQPTGR